jgi:hypothetical protein
VPRIVTRPPSTARNGCTDVIAAAAEPTCEV